MFGIEYKDALSLFRTLDLKEAAKIMISILEASLFGFDVQIIEEPISLLLITKQQQQRLLLQRKDIIILHSNFNQQWIVIIGSNAYLISYLDSPTNDFDSPSHTMIRNHFIKSIKFLGDDSAAPATTVQTIKISTSHIN